MDVNTTTFTYSAYDNDPKIPVPERIMVGLIFTTTSSLLITLYAFSVYVLATDQDGSRHFYHKMMISAGLIDLLQLFTTGLMPGIWTLVQACSSDHWLNKIVGSVACSAWFTALVSAHALAFNRFVHVFFSTNARRIFSPKLSIVYLCALWTYGLAWTVTLNLPRIDFVFYGHDYSSDYGSSAESLVVSIVDQCTATSNVASMIVLYVCIYCRSRRTKILMENQTQRNNMRKDRVVFVQAGLICLVIGGFVLMYNVQPYVCKHRLCYALVHTCWILSAGANPIIYLSANRNFRTRFLMLFTSLMKLFKDRIVVHIRQNTTSAVERIFLPAKPTINHQQDSTP